MTDESLIPILSIIHEISEEFDTLRFGEIVQNAVDMKFKSNNNNLTDKSSKQIMLALSDYYNYLKVKKNGS